MPNLSSNRQNEALVALGEAIRRERKRKHLSQEALALIANVDRSYLGRVERGDNNVAFLVLIRLANALGLSVSQLTKDAGL
ncbi:MAG: helix-turn-helix transcriptional regulator [Rhodocyclaceae bacterium]|nr:helix-turn-helix transcriptional regulator [Rhodocyclaceae bacterium]